MGPSRDYAVKRKTNATEDAERNKRSKSSGKQAAVKEDGLHTAQGRSRSKSLNREASQDSSAQFTEGRDQFRMTVNNPEGDVEENLAEENDDSDHDESLDYFDDEDRSTTDSVKILRMTDEERRERIRELDADMAGKMMELHQLMYDSGMTQTSKFMAEHFDVDDHGVKAIVRNGRGKQPGMPPEHLYSPDKEPLNRNYNHNPSYNLAEISKSVETIYKNAVEKRVSSSSDECIDISDETLGLLVDGEDNILGGDKEEVPQPSTSSGGGRSRFHPEPLRSRSPERARRDDGQRRAWSRSSPAIDPQRAAAEKAEREILNAEAHKARQLPTTGKPLEFTALIDQDYLVVGGHVDQAMQEKIINSEYIDFGKLLPKDRILAEEDSRLELVVKNGRTFWVPVSESVNINCFSRWEQAFRIYANVYTQRYPSRATELIQYNHVIHSISGIYVWENVYAYDKEFRLHLAKHPDRSWAVILQQAWSMKLKDRIQNRSENSAQSFHSPTGGGSATKLQSGEPCRRFNRGKCNFGPSCKFDHHCAYEPCGKFGHSILNCRKLQADRDKNRKQGTNSHPDNEKHRAVNPDSH